MVRYNENDVPDKYGFTRKEHVIWNLAYDKKTLNDADFIPTEEDIEYFNRSKDAYDRARAYKGHDFRFEQFVNDID